MRYIKGYSLLISLFFLASIAGYSQEGTYVEIRDLESWTSAELNYKVNKHWNFGLQSQLRLDNDASSRKSYLTQFTIDYSFAKNFQLGIGFRHIIENDTEGDIQGNENHFRLQLDASYKHKINRFKLKYRFRYTNKNEFGITSAEGDFPIKFLRLKTGVEYNIKNWKFDPEFSAEIFSKYIKYSQFNGLDSYRISIGTSYKMKSIGKFGLYYRMEREIFNAYPKTTNIIQFKYAYTLKRKKDDK